MSKNYIFKKYIFYQIHIQTIYRKIIYWKRIIILIKKYNSIMIIKARYSYIVFVVVYGRA